MPNSVKNQLRNLYLTNNVTYIRYYSLDFLQFSIAQPNLDSVCNSDNFTVFGADNKIPVICGDNNGQHST